MKQFSHFALKVRLNGYAVKFKLLIKFQRNTETFSCGNENFNLSKVVQKL